MIKMIISKHHNGVLIHQEEREIGWKLACFKIAGIIAINILHMPIDPIYNAVMRMAGLKSRKYRRMSLGVEK